MFDEQKDWIKRQDKFGAAILIVAILIIAVGTFMKPTHTEFPEEFVITFEQLDEIKELADNRDRNYGEILDDISNKIDELKQQARDEWEMKKEVNEESQQNIIEEQTF